VLSAIAAVHSNTLAIPSSIEHFLSGWHFGAPATSIGTHNLSRFLCSILFYVDSPGELNADERLELDALAQSCSRHLRSWHPILTR